MPTGDAAPGAGARETRARALWSSFEPVHAVTYFAPESLEQLADTGLRGFWMGYFAARSAPMGPVGPSVVSATFFSFHPSMVRRAIPDAWSFAAPTAVLEARRRGAAAALRRLHPPVDEEAGALVPLIDRVVGAADASGRALFGANRELDAVSDATEALWQGCTSLREQRGDGHVAALVAGGLDGCEALVTMAASGGIPGDVFRSSRGWSSDEWEAAGLRLDRRGLLDGDALSPAGEALRRSVEETTDRLAAAPFDVLSEDELQVLSDGLQRVAEGVTGQDAIPFPNPIGLPRPGPN